ncbi:hypothetical protein ABIB48_000154 [Arthrobacter sp. UYCu511]|uniref:septation protein SepH n=1 Tax=Arthrobacter sp. UYCu511 TaxID=3156337 RepID=UPI0033929ACE
MADLRLVGVHDDGEHLLLSGPDGDNYLLPLDEALRTAVGRTSQRAPRLNQPGARMTPREIQSLIRAGSNASDVADQSGLTLEQVRRYEGPVLAEREYIANQARAVSVATSTQHTENYSSSMAQEPTTLEEMVLHRLSAFGIEKASLRWDAWRDHAGAWTISADFEPGTEWAASSIGQAPPALWSFHAGRKSLKNANRWAQQLSELEPLDSPVPERRLSAVADKPFDVEAEAVADPHSPESFDGGDGAEPEHSPDASSEAVVKEQDSSTGYSGHGFLDMLRSRRGVRLGIDEDGDDELAAMLGTHVPGAHPRDEARYSLTTDTQEPASTTQGTDSPSDQVKKMPFLQLAPRLVEDTHVGSVAEVSTETREIVLSGEPLARLKPLQEPAAPESSEYRAPSAGPLEAAESGPSDSEVAARLERKAAAKPKRSSVPSWDEIVFGTKGD